MELQAVEVVAEGLGFPEGPVALPDGSVLVVEITNHRLSRVDPSGAVSVVADLGGGPNGAAIGPDGAVYVCNNGGMTRDSRIAPCIQRVELATGRHEVLYASCAGQPLGSPNDLVFDTAGGFWFSDYAAGAIFYAAADGSAITCAAKHVDAPNGVGLSPDGQVLYWAQTKTRQVLRRRITGPGQLEPSAGIDVRAILRSGAIDTYALVAGLPGLRELDSLAVEAGGAVCVGTLVDSGITFVDPSGEPPQLWRLPAALHDGAVTNICFGGSDLQTAYLTCSLTGRLVSCRWPRPGLPLAFGGVVPTAGGASGS